MGKVHAFGAILGIIDEFVQELELTSELQHGLNETAVKAYNSYQRSPNFDLFIRFDIIYYLENNIAHIINQSKIDVWESYIQQLQVLKNCLKEQTLFESIPMVKDLMGRIDSKIQKAKGIYIEWPEHRLVDLVNHKIEPIKY